MSLFGFFSKDSTTNTTTNNSYTDKSANAAQGSLAAGAGSNVVVNTTTADPSIALGALAANQNVAQLALSGQYLTSRDALNTAGNVAQSAIDTTGQVASDAINTVVGLQNVAAREQQGTLDSTNLALTTNQGLIDKLSSLTDAALNRTQDPGAASTKIALYVGGAVAVALIIALFSKKGKTA